MKKLRVVCFLLFALCMSVSVVSAAEQNGAYEKEYAYKVGSYMDMVWVPEVSEVRVTAYSGWWIEHGNAQTAVLALYEGEGGRLSDIKVIKRTGGGSRVTLRYQGEEAPICRVLGVDSNWNPVTSPIEWQAEETEGVTIKREFGHIFPNSGDSATSGKHTLYVYHNGERLSDYTLTSENENICSCKKEADGATTLTVNGVGDTRLFVMVGSEKYTFFWRVNNSVQADGITLRWDGNIISQNGRFGIAGGTRQVLYLCKDGAAIPAEDYTCESKNPWVCNVSREGDKLILTPENGGESSLEFVYGGKTYCFFWRDERVAAAVRWTGPGEIVWDKEEGATEYKVCLYNERGERISVSGTTGTKQEVYSLLGYAGAERSQRYRIEVEARYEKREKKVLGNVYVDATVGNTAVQYTVTAADESAYTLTLKDSVREGQVLLRTWKNAHECTRTEFPRGDEAYSANGRMIKDDSLDVRLITEDALSGDTWSVSLTAPAAISYHEILNAVPRAWYEVEDGTLYIRTNIDSSSWKNGYSGTIRCHYSDGNRDHDNGGGFGGNASFSVLTLPFYNAGTVVTKVDYVVYDTVSGCQEFWALFTELGDFDAAVNTYSEHVVARFELDAPLVVTDGDGALTLQSFDISYDEVKQQETYTAVLKEPLSNEGEYSLHYVGKVGGQSAGMTAIRRSGGKLTFTRNIHHFANAGASGYFKIVYSVCKEREDGSFACEKTESNLYPYTFIK